MRALPASLNAVIRLAKETIVLTGEQPPLLIVHGSKEQGMIPFGEFPASSGEKQKLMFTTGFQIATTKDLGALCEVFFLSEAWLSFGTMDRPIQRRPAEDPEHKEALIVSYLNPPQRTQGTAVFEVRRGADGELVELKQLTSGEPGEWSAPESPLLNAFIAGFVMGVKEAKR